MNSLRSGTALLCALGMIAGFAPAALAQNSAPSKVTVEYVAPEKFTDFRDAIFETEKGTQSLIQRLNEHLTDLARRYVPDGQRLELRFTDIDLAGDFEPWRGPSFDDIRIVKDLYPPRMQFDYRLVDATTGAVIRQGSEKLSDLAFLMTAPRLPSDDSLKYDKELLSNWMRREFKRVK